MSSLPMSPKHMTEAEYLKFDAETDIKYEYVDGEVFAMTGATENHVLISGNTFASLHSQFKGSGCKVYQADMRVRVERLQQYFYPDISAVCDKAQFAENMLDSLLNPMLIIEVLSSSTAAYDRGLKFQKYRMLPSLREYVLIEQDRPSIERYWLNQADKWELTDALGLDASLQLLSVDCELLLRDVYDLVEFPDADESSDK